jgi:hypothetical protein
MKSLSESCVLENDHPPALKVKIVDERYIRPDLENIEEHTKWMEKLSDTFGVQNSSFASLLLTQSITGSYALKAVGEPRANAIVSAIDELGPKNAFEAMTCTQMIALHNQALKMLEHASTTSSPDIAASYLHMAIKLTKAYTGLAEFFRKQRQKGHQHISVEHVHVHQGGQAIVGAVTQAGGRVT